MDGSKADPGTGGTARAAAHQTRPRPGASAFVRERFADAPHPPPDWRTAAFRCSPSGAPPAAAAQSDSRRLRRAPPRSSAARRRSEVRDPADTVGMSTAPRGPERQRSARAVVPAEEGAAAREAAAVRRDRDRRPRLAATASLSPPERRALGCRSRAVARAPTRPRSAAGTHDHDRFAWVHAAVRAGTPRDLHVYNTRMSGVNGGARTVLARSKEP